MIKIINIALQGGGAHGAFVWGVLDKFLKDVLLHSIRGDRTMCELSVPSKFNADWAFLMYLFTKGRATADEWIQENYSYLGKNSTVDLYREFLQADDRLD